MNSLLAVVQFTSRSLTFANNFLFLFSTLVRYVPLRRVLTCSMGLVLVISDLNDRLELSPVCIILFRSIPYIYNFVINATTAS